MTLIFSKICFLDIPQLSVTVGTPKSFILEGDAVYFECNIGANPSVTEVGWHFNDNPLYSDITAGIKVENKSLLLHKITRKHSGNYSCIAANAEGEGASENVAIDVQCMFIFFHFSLLLRDVEFNVCKISCV